MLFEDVDGKILLRDSRFCVRTCMREKGTERKRQSILMMTDVHLCYLLNICN